MNNISEGFSQLAVAVVSVISPFLPQLLNLGKSVAKAVTEEVSERIVDKGWNRAAALWAKIKEHFGNHDELMDAAQLLAHRPDDEDRQTIFASILNTLLVANPDVVADFLSLMGGKEAVAEVVATRDSVVRRVRQRISYGHARVQADDSEITDVEQTID